MKLRHSIASGFPSSFPLRVPLIIGKRTSDLPMHGTGIVHRTRIDMFENSVAGNYADTKTGTASGGCASVRSIQVFLMRLHCPVANLCTMFISGNNSRHETGGHFTDIDFHSSRLERERLDALNARIDRTWISIKQPWK